jgi:LysR family transcriptional regulator for metE and metH
MILEVRHLQLISAICETRNVARAADRLHLSQPAVSHALRSLEDRLGVRLFERATKMSPTPVGAQLNDAARRILADVRQVEEQVARHRSGQAGTVRVATECYTCYHWLPPALKKLRVNASNIAVEIAPNVTARALDALLKGEIDVALVLGNPEHRRLSAEKLFVDELLLIASPDHPLARRKFVLPADFATERLLVHQDLESGTFWQRFLKPANVRPAEIVPLHLTEAMVESVKAGLGVAVLARWAVAHALTSKDVVGVHLGRHGLRRAWYAVTRRGPAEPATTALLGILRTDAKKATRAY